MRINELLYSIFLKGLKCVAIAKRIGALHTIALFHDMHAVKNKNTRMKSIH